MQTTKHTSISNHSDGGTRPCLRGSLETIHITHQTTAVPKRVVVLSPRSKTGVGGVTLEYNTGVGQTGNGAGVELEWSGNKKKVKVFNLYLQALLTKG